MVLVYDGFVIEFIVDGIYFYFLVVKFVFLVKGSSKFILIIDFMRVKGLKDGVYEFGG